MASDCKAEEYCKVAACAVAGGTCTPRPVATSAPNPSPVCGCDDVTYWDENTALARFGVTVKASGQCAAPVKCGGNTKCDGARACNLAVASFGQCGGIGATSGTCWGLPSSCTAQGGKFSQCNGGDTCISACEAIKAQKLFYSSFNCPP